MSDTVTAKPTSPEIDQHVTPKGFQSIPLMKWVDYVGTFTELVEPLVFVSSEGETITIPAGFKTDYASIPKIFRNIYEPSGPARFPAILHDFLYQSRGYGPYYKTRAECDALFLDAMRLVGVDVVQRTTIYNAVRLFGWAYSFKPGWNKGRSSEG